MGGRDPEYGYAYLPWELGSWTMAVRKDGQRGPMSSTTRLTGGILNQVNESVKT